MKILCVFGKYQYGDPARGIGIEYEAFIPALQRLGHEVLFFETWDAQLHPTYSDLNHALLETVRTFQPGIVFTVQRDYEIWLESLAYIRSHSSCALVTWTTDDSFKFNLVSKYIGSYYDAIGTTYDYRVKDYRDANIPGAFVTQWAANSHWLREPKPASDCLYDVSFVGAKYGSRGAIVEQLASHGIKVECFGHGWPNGSVATEEIPAIMRDTRISLNFSSGFLGNGEAEKQIKARIFEVPGAGGFLLTEATPGLEKVYRIGSEIETFTDFDSLVEKLNHFRSHPQDRDRIALAGFERTAASHTYEVRLGALIEFALEQAQSRRAAAVHPGANELDGANVAVDNSRLGPGLRGLRWLLINVASLVWGSRGPKAARRLVFSLSRILCGSRTFTSRGLPGRLFPYV